MLPITDSEPDQAKHLAQALIGTLKESGAIRSTRLEDAFRAVPRHRFLPDAELEMAYRDAAVVTKRDELGASMSSVSAPWLVATMLEQLDVRPGHRVLEIGSGGYNAALLAELVGPTGSVTTVDIDPDVTDRASRCLADAGYDNVTVLCADGEFGAPTHAPFDRIVVTVEAPDIPPAWIEQLAGSGRIVVPIRMRGLTRSVAFDRENDRLVSRNYETCGFVPMQGAGQNHERIITLGEQVELRIDDDQKFNAEALRAALTSPRMEAWSGVSVGRGERIDGPHLWLAHKLPTFAILTAKPEAVERGIVAYTSPIGSPARANETSLAYLVLEHTSPGNDRWEFGAYGHGPDGAALAKQIVDLVQIWDGTHANASIVAFPADTKDGQLPQDALVINKRHARIAISWPRAS